VDASEGMGRDSELRKVAGVIGDPQQQESFALDPDTTLRDAGVDVDKLPSSVRDALYGLSHAEVRALARVKESLREAGVSDEDTLEIF
jgi:hypothetical protein